MTNNGSDAEPNNDTAPTAKDSLLDAPFCNEYNRNNNKINPLMIALK